MLTIAIALVWLVNGFLCKLLNWVPRHQLIVSRILGEEHAYIATKIIGILEILMSIWVLSNIKSRWCAITQIIIVAIMNIIEFFLVSKILLFGRSNAILAAILIVIIFLNEFVLNRANHKRSI
ncbi:MAG TPA: DoxX-like family protein [Chitinophagaceae bacterium]|nr:DoxX-like family protein [Chitinophagaceae bacterium]